MLVGKRMKSPVITVQPELPIVDALELMKREKIRRLPVVKDGRLVGIVSDVDLLNASPSPATSLSVWEMNYLLSKIQVKDVMTKNVLTISEDTPIEEAARIMADNKIGGLPVMRGENLTGIITETDLFKIFLELMGAREPGVRATVIISDEKGSLAKLTQAIANCGGNFVAFGQFYAEEVQNRMVTMKVRGIEAEEFRKVLEPVVLQVTDLRASNV